jgi:hypothetical protein
MESVAKKHADKVEFLFVYCREAHPQGDKRGRETKTKKGEVIRQADSQAERKRIAEEFCSDLKMSRRILIDEFGEKSAQRAYGGLNNPTVVIGVDGKIALKMAWTNGETLDRFLTPFLAKGGKYDEELAKGVAAGRPRGR